MSRVVEHEIRSATGDLLYTSPHEDLARRYARKNAKRYPGLYLERVETIVIRRRLWTDRANMAAPSTGRELQPNQQGAAA